MSHTDEFHQDDEFDPEPHQPSIAASSVSTSSDETLNISGLQAALDSSIMAIKKEITLPSGKKTFVDVTKTASLVASSSDSVPVYVQLSSAKRILLPAKEQAEYHKSITSLQHPKFKALDTSLEKISDLVSVHTCLETTERHFQQFDLMDTFYIIKPDRDSNAEILHSYSSDPACNLFKDYAMLTLQDVIASTQWYATFPSEPYHRQNLALTLEYLRTHTQAGLERKVNFALKSVPAGCRSGPVFLFLLIGQLMASNESTAKTLISRLETIKISSYDGEDVEVVVSHLNAILDRLKAMHYVDSVGQSISQVPKHLSEIFYKIFQTSSNDQFNSFFALRYTTDRAASLTSSDFNSKFWTAPDDLVLQATNLYRQLCLAGDWHGIKQHKATFPVISDRKQAQAFISTIHCHNCGGPHLLKSCDKPRNETRIAQNLAEFRRIKNLARSQAGTSPSSSAPSNPQRRNGKWPPRPADRNHAHVTIDGKPHFFHFKKNRWLPVSSPPRGSSDSAGAHAASTPGASTPSTHGTTPPASSASSLTGASRTSGKPGKPPPSLAFAHLTQELTDTMTRLTRHYEEEED